MLPSNAELSTGSTSSASENPTSSAISHVQEFVPDATSWKDLFREWNNTPNKPATFKLWLKQDKGAVVTAHVSAPWQRNL